MVNHTWLQEYVYITQVSQCLKPYIITQISMFLSSLYPTNKAWRRRTSNHFYITTAASSPTGDLTKFPNVMYTGGELSTGSYGMIITRKITRLRFNDSVVASLFLCLPPPPPPKRRNKTTIARTVFISQAQKSLHLKIYCQINRHAGLFKKACLCLYIPLTSWYVITWESNWKSQTGNKKTLAAFYLLSFFIIHCCFFFSTFNKCLASTRDIHIIGVGETCFLFFLLLRIRYVLFDVVQRCRTC